MTALDRQTIDRSSSTRINNDARAGTFTILAALILASFSAGVIAGIVYHPLWFSVAAGGIGGALMLIWRVMEHDKRATTTSTRQTQESTVPAETVRPEVVTNTGNNAKHIKRGKYRLTYREWHRLGRVLLSGDGRFVRDVVASAKVFKNITSNWGDIVAEFERLGMVRDGQLTAAGIGWFSKFNSPVAPPHPVGYDYSEDY